MENIDALKNHISGTPKYKLANANVYVSSHGFHYIDYLDPIEATAATDSEHTLSPADIEYIENSLQSNAERFKNHVSIVTEQTPAKDKRLLDIGCGGGLFLSMMKQLGTNVTGIELSGDRVQYAQKKYDLDIVQHTIEDEYWQSGHEQAFDIVTLWDVIEHVNFPASTLQCATRVLKKGGYLFIDTPCRDSFYHRAGELTYKLSGGKFPTFLNTMYSAHRFGHKQIFSTSEMKLLLEQLGLEVVTLNKFHELSFPYEFYLRKLLKSESLAKLSVPAVKLMLTLFPVKNKMLAIGYKR